MAFVFVAIKSQKSLEAPRGLTAGVLCSMFVLMEVETLGVARSLGWKVHMRCANGYRQETRSMRKCVYHRMLDLKTLVATKGPNFPLGRLEGVDVPWDQEGNGGLSAAKQTNELVAHDLRPKEEPHRKVFAGARPTCPRLART